MINQPQFLNAFLAQSSVPPSQAAANLRFWLYIGGLVLLISVGSLFIFWARRCARGPVPTNRPGFTLEDLGAMLDRGEITQREYDTARDTMLNKARQAAAGEIQGPADAGPQRQGGQGLAAQGRGQAELVRHAAVLSADRVGGVSEGIIEARYDRPIVLQRLQPEDPSP